MLALLLLASPVFADYDVYLSSGKIELFENETTSIIVNVVNFGVRTETIEVSLTPSEDWISLPDQVVVAADSAKSFKIQLEPEANTRGDYKKTLTLRSIKSGTKTKSIDITVKSS
ncbi:MAG: hypothetical protein ACTSPB_24720, partial [Candidatus Thorarchaeota archaeon]